MAFSKRYGCRQYRCSVIQYRRSERIRSAASAAGMYNDSLSAGSRYCIDQVVNVKRRDGSDADIASRCKMVALGSVSAFQFGAVGLTDFANIVRPLILSKDDTGCQCRTTAEDKPAFEIGTLVELAPTRYDCRTPQTAGT